MTTEKIYIQIGDEKIELTGAEKKAFIIDTENRQNDLAELEAKKTARIQAKASAQAKLAALGLTVEDLTALGL